MYQNICSRTSQKTSSLNYDQNKNEKLDNRRLKISTKKKRVGLRKYKVEIPEKME